VPRDVTVAGVPAKVVRDRRFSGPRLVEDDFDPTKLDDENIRWSCAL
jgi:serine O-acetyltransferase